MYKVLFSQSALEDLEYLSKDAQQTVIDAVSRQLSHDPLKVTKNRKPLRPNQLATWEVRTGTYRILYDVDVQADEVSVKAVGVKEHSRLVIRGKEYPL